MKKLLSFSFLFLLISNIILAQETKTYHFEDGTSVDVEILRTHPDLGKKMTANLGGFYYPRYTTFLGFSYYLPRKVHLNLQGGINGGIVDGTIIFLNRLKDKTLKNSVNRRTEGNTKILHVIEIPIQKRKSYGAHLGTEYFKGEYYEFENNNDFTVGSIIAGLSMIGAKSTHWKIDSKYKEAQGTSFERLNLDVVYYYHKKTNGTIPTGKTIDDIFRTIVPRVSYEQKFTFWSRKGNIGLNYMLGLQLPLAKDVKVPVFGGVGLSFFFH